MVLPPAQQHGRKECSICVDFSGNWKGLVVCMPQSSMWDPTGQQVLLAGRIEKRIVACRCPCTSQSSQV